MNWEEMMVTRYNLRIYINGNYIDQYRDVFKMSYDKLIESIKSNKEIHCRTEDHDTVNTKNIYLTCERTEQNKITIDLVYWYLDISSKQNMKEYIALAEKYEQA
jgi:hypothetical protein